MLYYLYIIILYLIWTEKLTIGEIIKEIIG